MVTWLSCLLFSYRQTLGQIFNRKSLIFCLCVFSVHDFEPTIGFKNSPYCSPGAFRICCYCCWAICAYGSTRFRKILMIRPDVLASVYRIKSFNTKNVLPLNGRLRVFVKLTPSPRSEGSAEKVPRTSTSATLVLNCNTYCVSIVDSDAYIIN